MKKVLDMTEEEARNYFMKNSSYFSMSLPEYLDFTNLLVDVDKKINNLPLSKLWHDKPEKYDDINYKFQQNKDGKFAWRMFQLIHPAIYVDLVNLITETENWKLIVDRFKEFKSNEKIVCCSDIVESSSKTKDQGASIMNWWNNVEQKSIELSLKYNWIGITDITDCYGSIYTHSIAWALHGMSTAKINRKETLIGNAIDKEIRNMTYGQTNGIPQGSSLMDFIAEIVLGYGDLLLTEILKKEKIEDYTILRYRDDYRVFTKDESTLNKILKLLSENLSILNFKMNTQKTTISNDVISKSIKRDKIDALDLNLNSDISIQKKLLVIREFANKNPNSGSLKTILVDFYKETIEKLKKKRNDNKEIISIIVDLMYNNPNIYQICVIILSKLLSFENKSNKELIIKCIEEKFSKLPNTDYLSIWLQRITLTYNAKREFNSKICKIIYDSTTKLWNSNWLNIDINEELIVDKLVIKELTPVISSKELDIFDDYNW